MARTTDETIVEVVQRTAAEVTMVANVLVVDDEKAVLEGITRATRRESFRVVGANNAAEALELLEANRFDVVVSDENMPGMRGSEFLSIVFEQYPATVRILLTGSADIGATIRAINEARIFRYIEKPVERAHIVATIHEAIEVKRARDVNNRLVKAARRQLKTVRRLESEFPGFLERGTTMLSDNDVTTARPRWNVEALDKLSPREREVAKALADGKTSREIAEALFVSPHTTRNHIKSIYRKLDVHSRTELIKRLAGIELE